MIIETKYCDRCEHIVRLTEDGYCTGCGKHADNMPNFDDDVDPDYDDFPNQFIDDNELGGEG